MGKKYSLLVRAIARATQDCKTSKKQLALSVVSLVLTFAILMTCTYSWYYIKTATAESGLFSLDAGKGLRVNDSGTIGFGFDENDFSLIPASSVDGRNLYFPTDGDDFSDVNRNITYRSANAGDKNNNYIQIEFQVTAQANNTAIYINTDTDKTKLMVKPEGADENSFDEISAAPLRMAIWSTAPNEADNFSPADPVVFNSQKKTVNTAAVSEVDRASGTYISSSPQVAHQFSDYAIGGEPLAILSAGKLTKFTIVIWLEGNDPKCKYNRISSKNVRLDLALKTSWDKTDVVRFKDSSSDKWIKNLIDTRNYKLSVRYTRKIDADTYDTNQTSAFTMYPYGNAGDEWSASVPIDMKDKIEFILSPKSGGEGDVYTFNMSDGYGGTTAGVANTFNRGVNRQYVVNNTFDNKGASASLCQGHWVSLGDSDGGGVDIGDLDGDDF